MASRWLVRGEGQGQAVHWTAPCGEKSLLSCGGRVCLLAGFWGSMTISGECAVIIQGSFNPLIILGYPPGTVLCVLVCISGARRERSAQLRPEICEESMRLAPLQYLQCMYT
jgi:hypothetical protein